CEALLVEEALGGAVEVADSVDHVVDGKHLLPPERANESTIPALRGTTLGHVEERILLVEDDPSIREGTALGLERAGFRVTASADGREGLLRARRDDFELVLLDVMLPSLDGFEVC